MYKTYSFLNTGLVYELGPPDSSAFHYIFKLNKQQKEKKYEHL